MITCNRCKEIMSWENLQNHFEMVCVVQCKACKTKCQGRKQFKLHIEEVCTETPRKCIGHKYGCKTRLRPDILATHVSLCNEAQLVLECMQYKKLKHSLIDSQTKITTLKRKLNIKDNVKRVRVRQ
jgi:hypothetical protein